MSTATQLNKERALRERKERVRFVPACFRRIALECPADELG